MNERLNDIGAVMSRLSLGEAKVRRLIRTGQLRSVKVGTRRLVSEAALNEFIARLDGRHAPGAEMSERIIS